MSKAITNVVRRDQYTQEWLDASQSSKLTNLKGPRDEETCEEGFAARLYTLCQYALQDLCKEYQHSSRGPLQTVLLREELAKLYLWGQSFGPGELDLAIEYSDDARHITLDALLCIGLSLLCELSRIQTPDSRHAYTEQRGRELNFLLEQARSIVSTRNHRDEDTGSDASSDSDESSSSNIEEASDIIEELRSHVSHLVELGPILVQNVAYARKAHTKSSHPPVIPFHLSDPAKVYVSLVREKFRNAQDHLVDRLGESNWQRHNMVRQQMKNANSRLGVDSGLVVESSTIYLDHKDDLFSEFRPFSAFHDSGIGTSLPAHTTYAPSHTSFQSTNPDGENVSVRVPPMPEQFGPGKSCMCPICGNTLPNIANRIEWKMHVFADLRPYLCTFAGCKMELAQFTTRTEWADHEFSEHRVVRLWACSECAEECACEGDWVEHLKKCHQRIFSGPSYHIAKNMACTIRAKPIENEECPLCQAVFAKSRRDFVKHVGRHMEEIALIALPRGDDEESDTDSSDTAARSIRSFIPQDKVSPSEGLEPSRPRASDDPIPKSFIPESQAYAPTRPSEPKPASTENVVAKLDSLQPFECPFILLGCRRYFINEQDWVQHSLSHFKSTDRVVGPPTRNVCCFCDENFHSHDALESWLMRMEHIRVHHLLGHRLEDARPDLELFGYLYQHKLIDDSTYNEIMASSGNRRVESVDEKGDFIHSSQAHNLFLLVKDDSTAYCDICSAKFQGTPRDRESNLEHHLKTVHSLLEIQKCSQSGCIKIFGQLNTLQNHCRVAHHGVIAKGPPSEAYPIPPPPEWLTNALIRLQQSYPDDAFEGTMRYTAVSRVSDLPVAVRSEQPQPQAVLYMYYPRIKCKDCPGKLYTPGPEESVSNFEVHLKNRLHRKRSLARNDECRRRTLVNMGHNEHEIKDLSAGCGPKQTPLPPRTKRLEGRNKKRLLDALQGNVLQDTRGSPIEENASSSSLEREVTAPQSIGNLEAVQTPGAPRLAHATLPGGSSCRNRGEEGRISEGGSEAMIKPSPSAKVLPKIHDHVIDQLSAHGDEYVEILHDGKGELKISKLGELSGGRTFKVRTFLIPNRGLKLFMLANECAQALKYKNSYEISDALFDKNRALYKIIANQSEKDDLISRGIVPFPYRSDEVALVTARSIFRQFGSRIIRNGRRVRDDYWESKAVEQGFTEDDVEGSEKPGWAKENYTTWYSPQMTSDIAKAFEKQSF